MVVNCAGSCRLWAVAFCLCLLMGGADAREAVHTKKNKSSASAIDTKKQMPELAEQFGADASSKRLAVQELVNKAAQQLQERKAKDVFDAITWTSEFKKGEIYLFVYDLKGNLLAHGEEPWFIWQNLSSLQDDFGVTFVQGLIDTAQKKTNGGFYTYRWHGVLKNTYVRLVEKDGASYLVCGGYYLYTAADFVTSLVKGAVARFNNYVASDLGKEAAFGFLNYRFGSFVFGDLYLKVLDERGNLLVYGLRPNTVGANVWDVHDEQGIFYNRESIEKLSLLPVDEGIWFEYTVNNAIKKTYAERVVDARGKSYFIESGYFPHGQAQSSLGAQEGLVIDFVHNGIRFAKNHTAAQVAQAFAQIAPYQGDPKNTFIRGDLFLFALKLDGTMIISGLNPEDAGKNFWNDQDADGRFLIREIITKTENRTKTWLAFKRKNSFWSVYSELATVDGEPVIIGCGFYPIAKINTMTLLVKSAVKYLKTHEDMQVFETFVAEDSSFVHGDMAIGVVDTKGFCYADGVNHALIWKDMNAVKDEAGVPFMQELIKKAQRGPATVRARIYGAEKLFYAEPVTKGGMTYIVYSSYYPSEQEKISQELFVHGSLGKLLQTGVEKRESEEVEEPVAPKVPAEKKESVVMRHLPAQKKNDAHDTEKNGKGEPYAFLDDQQAEIELKRERVEALVEKGKKVFNEHSFAQACNMITHDSALRDGELFLWIHALDGTVVAYGEDPRLIWQNLYNFKDDFGFYPMRVLIQLALNGGGWHSYRWNKATKTSYVQLVEKDGKKYEMGSGYFAASKAEEVVSLVKGAADLFTSYIAQGVGKDAAFGVFMYPMGSFMYGDLYIYVLDDAGITVVHEEKPGFTGTPSWQVKDPTGKHYVQELITTMRKVPVGQGHWFHYISKNAPKDLYAQRVVDRTGANYYIASGFYPETNREKVIDLVARGYQYLKTYGKTAAKDAFLSLSAKDASDQHLIWGDLGLFLIDFSGKVEVFADMPEYSGRNLLNFKDATGRFIVKEVIAKLKKEERAWLDFRIKNAFWSIYVERVDMGMEQLIIGSGFFPVNKLEMMHLMVHSAAEFLRINDDTVAFNAFSTRDGKFVRGDLQVFALDAAGGTCFTWGYVYDLIWRDLARKADQQGRMYIQALLDATQQEPATLDSRENNAYKVYYAESVFKDGRRYVVGSGYYP